MRALHTLLPACALPALVLSAAPFARAAELGDPAPQLAIANWVKGDPVDVERSKGKNVLVVEFWATWCGPCRVSIPHLTELQKKYREKGVVVVGVTNETDLEKVKKFVEDQGEKMDYVVAQDSENTTFARYMKAYDQRGIPTAFVVDREGRIVWVGHPMGELDLTLEAVARGDFDMEAAKRRAEERARQLAEARQKAASLREYFLQVRKTQQMGDLLLEDLKGNAVLLNQLAWTILTDEGVRGRDLDLALRVAKAALEACEGKDAAIVDTYARALFDTGKRAEAIEHQKRAISLCEDPELRSQLEQTLRDYEKAMGSLTL